MAIVISGAQLYIANKQAGLAETQLKVAYYQATPKIRAIVKKTMDVKSQKYNKEELYIYNDGFPVFETSSKIIVFIDAELISKTNPLEQYQYEIALGNYYIGTGRTNESEGLLSVSSGSENWDRFISIYDDFEVLAKSKGFLSNLSLKTYLYFSYKNIFDEKESLFFSVDSIKGSERISEDEGVKIFQEHYDSFGSNKFQKLHELTAQKLFNLISTRPRT